VGGEVEGRARPARTEVEKGRSMQLQQSYREAKGTPAEEGKENGLSREKEYFNNSRVGTR